MYSSIHFLMYKHLCDHHSEQNIEHFLHPGRLPHALSQQRQSLFLAVYYYLKEREIPGGCISGVWVSRKLFQKREGVGGVGESGRQRANWAAPPPAVVAGFRSAGFRVCFLSTIWMNRHVARLENRRRKPFLCPNTTEKVSIHWLQSHSSLVLLQFYLSHLVLRPGCSWMFWLHIHSLLVCFHTWLLFQERLDRFNSGWQFSPIASSSGCTVNALSELH